MENSYDLIVLGAGPGGYEAALKAASAGLKTALVEARDIGGTCLNRGCIPTKALLHCSGVYHEAKEAASFMNSDGVVLSYPEIQKYKNDVVGKLRGNVETMLKKAGVTVIRGYGLLTDEHTITVNDERLTADYIILATGSVPSMPPIEGIDGQDIMNSDGFLDLDHFGDEIVIVGGGVIGIELATFLGQIGKSVTVIEMMDSILPGVDTDITRWLGRSLKSLGIKVITSATVKKFSDHLITYQCGEKTVEIPFDQCVVATGRKALTADLADSSVGLQMNRAFIVTDEHMKTSADNIYAIGDITGHQQLAHVASYQAMVAVENILGHEMAADYDTVPSCIYTDPEIACVGKNLSQLNEDDIIVCRYNSGANGRALIAGKSNGTVRIYADKNSHVILGGQIMAPAATDMITEISTLIRNKNTLEDLIETIHPHPTFSEIIREAAAAGLQTFQPGK